MSETHTSIAKQYIGATIVGVLLTIALALLLMAWRDGQPIAVPTVSNPKLDCASYTPSHDGHVLGAAATRALVRTDLEILAKHFACVRTYSVSEGLDEVPKIARELGLKVMLGCWIGADMQANRDELRRGVAIANQYGDVVTTIIIGNEVLLRRELTAAQLRTLMQETRAATKVPVTYADVWEFWLRNRELAEVADFVTIHILPYWEDSPVPIEHALDHVKSIYGKVQTAFPRKTIFLGETGWPSAGRQRIQAVPSLINEARFIREFVAYAELEHIPYNIIEAFDQPWKRIQEGTVGGFWGLYDVNGQMKFAFDGAVVARPNWRVAPLMALLGTALFAVTGWWLLRRQANFSWRVILFLGFAGHVAGSVVVTQWRYLNDANRNVLEWLATIAWTFCGWAVYAMACSVIAQWLYANMPLKQPAMAADIVRSWGYGKPIANCQGRLFGVVRMLFLVGMAYVSLGLVYDGRGRDFPIAIIGLPVLMLACVEVAAFVERRAATKPDASYSEEWLLASCLGLAPIYIAWNETYLNAHAMTWSALSALCAAALISNLLRESSGFGRAGTHEHERAEQQSCARQLESI